MLTELMIASLCASQPNLHQEACIKATTATTMQLEFKQNVDMVEDGTARYVVAKTSATAWAVGGILLKTYRDKSIRYKFTPRNSHLVDEITPVLDRHGGSIGFGWRF